MIGGAAGGAAPGGRYRHHTELVLRNSQLHHITGLFNPCRESVPPHVCASRPAFTSFGAAAEHDCQQAVWDQLVEVVAMGDACMRRRTAHTRCWHAQRREPGIGGAQIALQKTTIGLHE